MIQAEPTPLWVQYVELGSIAVLGLIYLTRLASCFHRLPARMATHFRVSGRADGWSTPAVWALVSVGAFVLTMLPGAFFVLKLKAGADPGIQVAVIAEAFAAGALYSAFSQVLEVGLGDRKTLSISSVFLWGFGVGAVVSLMNFIRV